MTKHYTDADKLEVVTTYLALGKIPMVEAVTGVNRHTIRQWKLQPWWREMVEQIQTESDQELDAKLSKIIERSLDAVNDRIENGDFIFDPKTGNIKRSPVKLRDVHRVSVDLLDKRDLIRGKPEQRVEQAQNADVLKKLADQFATWVKVHIKREQVEETVHALHEERKEGLQDGVQQVSQEQGAETPKSSPEHGPQGV